MRRLLIGIVLLALAACTPAAAPGADPVGVVKEIYRAYRKSDGLGPTNAIPFTPDLQTRLEIDREATPAGESGAIDFDPVVAGNAYSLRDLEITLETPPANGEAVVQARFRNFNMPTAVLYDMREKDGIWLVHNIRAGDAGWDVRQMLWDAAEARNASATPKP